MASDIKVLTGKVTVVNSGNTGFKLDSYDGWINLSKNGPAASLPLPQRGQVVEVTAAIWRDKLYLNSWVEAGPLADSVVQTAVNEYGATARYEELDPWEREPLAPVAAAQLAPAETMTAAQALGIESVPPAPPAPAPVAPPVAAPAAIRWEAILAEGPIDFYLFDMALRSLELEAKGIGLATQLERSRRFMALAGAPATDA